MKINRAPFSGGIEDVKNRFFEYGKRKAIIQEAFLIKSEKV
jgi:hypothetical protein